MTASWPLKVALRLAAEKSDLTTVTPAGKTASLSLRAIAVTVNSEDARRLLRIILPMLPLA